MGWIARAAACALLLSANPAAAGRRIGYPTYGQMYALLASDVRVTVGTAAPPTGFAGAQWTIRCPLLELAPDRAGFAEPSTMVHTAPRSLTSLSVEQAPPMFSAESFRQVGQDLFPERQRTRMHAPLDAMVTFSIGGPYGETGNLRVDGGVAGVLWTISHPMAVPPASP